jgi:hypothetical protein
MEARMTTTTRLPYQLPISKRKRARLDRQIDRQLRYEAKLKEKKAPKRADFAAVAIDLMCMVIEHRPQTKQARMAWRVLVDELVDAGFDELQCRIRLSTMCEGIDKHLARRRHLRELAAQNETTAEGAASAVDAK